MGREIKFRAWNGMELFEVYEIDFLNGVVRHVFRPGLVNDYDLKEVELMQYTGLKDKNGREIYEGDATKDEFDRVAIISWKENEARFAMTYIGQKTEYRMFISHLRMEVIGNIYENPELLP